MQGLSIFVLEDDARLREELAEYLESRNAAVYGADRPSAALRILAEHPVDVALIDIKLPESNGLEFLAELRRSYPHVEAIMMSGHGDMNSVIEALRLGAFDYLIKPFSPLDMHTALTRTRRFIELGRENRNLKTICEELSTQLSDDPSNRVVGTSAQIAEVVRLADLAAENADTPVLLQGESGTGKELFARRIHRNSARGSRPFVAVNCAAVPRELFESEFFGHSKGSFTDAKEDRTGYVRSADGGTLFLDELGEMPLALQSKLLRTLEDKTIRPVGSDKEFAVDIRVIGASNKPLRAQVDEGSFRMDLFYRLSVLEIAIPPLREHPEDIRPLLEFFWTELSVRMGRGRLPFPGDCVVPLEAYPFPGNVRELKNIVERMLISGDGSPPAYRGSGPAFCADSAGDFPGDSPGDSNADARAETGGTDLPVLDLERLERLAVEQALARTHGNQSRAAALLGISRQALARRIEKHTGRAP